MTRQSHRSWTYPLLATRPLTALGAEENQVIRPRIVTKATEKLQRPNQRPWVLESGHTDTSRASFRAIGVALFYGYEHDTLEGD